MTREEAINALDIVKHMESFSVLYEPEEPMNQTTVGGLKEACKMATSILRAQTDTPPNDPLTLEELREMDGEPVWCVIIDGDYKGESFWGLVSIDTAECICKNWDVIIFAYYGKTWIAYRRKPEEGEP